MDNPIQNLKDVFHCFIFEKERIPKMHFDLALKLSMY